MERWSEILKSEPLGPLEKAVHWMKLVERFRSLDHLKANTRSLSIAQYLLFDVFGFTLFCLLLFIFICYCLVKFMFLLSQKRIIIKKKLQ